MIDVYFCKQCGRRVQARKGGAKDKALAGRMIAFRHKLDSGKYCSGGGSPAESLTERKARTSTKSIRHRHDGVWADTTSYSRGSEKPPSSWTIYFGDHSLTVFYSYLIPQWQIYIRPGGIHIPLPDISVVPGQVSTDVMQRNGLRKYLEFLEKEKYRIDFLTKRAQEALGEE